MKAERTTATWIDELGFEAEVNGFKLILDAEPQVGGKNRGPRPKPLMQVSLAGCTAMDVISILKKMRLTPNIDDFKVHVDGELTEEHPKHYSSMHVTYELTGKNLPWEKVEKAVKLSQDRYCGVSFVYRKVMGFSYEIIIHDTEKGSTETRKYTE